MRHRHNRLLDATATVKRASQALQFDHRCIHVQCGHAYANEQRFGRPGARSPGAQGRAGMSQPPLHAAPCPPTGREMDARDRMGSTLHAPAEAQSFTPLGAASPPARGPASEREPPEPHGRPRSGRDGRRDCPGPARKSERRQSGLALHLSSLVLRWYLTGTTLVLHWYCDGTVMVL